MTCITALNWHKISLVLSSLSHLLRPEEPLPARQEECPPGHPQLQGPLGGRGELAHDGAWNILTWKKKHEKIPPIPIKAIWQLFRYYSVDVLLYHANHGVCTKKSSSGSTLLVLWKSLFSTLFKSFSSTTVVQKVQHFFFSKRFFWGQVSVLRFLEGFFFRRISAAAVHRRKPPRSRR